MTLVGRFKVCYTVSHSVTSTVHTTHAMIHAQRNNGQQERNQGERETGRETSHRQRTIVTTTPHHPTDTDFHGTNTSAPNPAPQRPAKENKGKGEGGNRGSRRWRSRMRPRGVLHPLYPGSTSSSAQTTAWHPKDARRCRNRRQNHPSTHHQLSVAAAPNKVRSDPIAFSVEIALNGR